MKMKEILEEKIKAFDDNIILDDGSEEEKIENSEEKDEKQLK